MVQRPKENEDLGNIWWTWMDLGSHTSWVNTVNQSQMLTSENCKQGPCLGQTLFAILVRNRRTIFCCFCPTPLCFIQSWHGLHADDNCHGNWGLRWCMSLFVRSSANHTSTVGLSITFPDILEQSVRTIIGNVSNDWMPMLQQIDEATHVWKGL